MKYAVVLLSVLVSVQAGSMNRGWAPTTPGWTTDPPTTAGWSTEEPTTLPPGWSGPPPQGWGPSHVTINLDGEAAATATGWAAENHAESVDAVGGWGVPADIDIISGGASTLDQHGSVSQFTNIDGESASSFNYAGVTHYADANEGAYLEAQGLAVNYGQSGWGAASGQGAIASDAHTSIVANGRNH